MHPSAAHILDVHARLGCRGINQSLYILKYQPMKFHSPDMPLPFVVLCPHMISLLFFCGALLPPWAPSSSPQFKIVTCCLGVPDLLPCSPGTQQNMLSPYAMPNVARIIVHLRLDPPDHIHALDNLSKHDVLAVQPSRLGRRDEELRAVYNHCSG